MYSLKKTPLAITFYAALVCVTGSAIAADYNPDIRPGLWESKVSLKGDMADAINAQIAAMPKEMQQLMREQMGNLPQELGTVEKECITPQQAKKYFNEIMGEEGCKNEFQWKDKNNSVLTSTCTDGTKQQSDIHIKSSKEITVTSNITQADGISGTSVWHSRWVSDDCGNVEPEK